MVIAYRFIEYDPGFLLYAEHLYIVMKSGGRDLVYYFLDDFMERYVKPLQEIKTTGIEKKLVSAGTVRRKTK